MRDRKSISLIAGLVTLGSLTAIVLKLYGGLPPRIDSRPHEASGWGLARQALRL